MSTFDDWLRQLAAAGKGGFTLPPATRGRAYAFAFEAQADFTGANGSAAAPASPNRRLAILAAYAINRE